MTLFTFLVVSAVILILSVPALRRKARVASFDPGSFPVAVITETKPNEPEARTAIRLGGEICWTPENHPNPHVLILGGSGSGKTWTIRHLAQALLRNGYDCVLFDFHGDLMLSGVETCPIAFDSGFGVNPLEVGLDSRGGGPDPQRFEVLEQLRNAFRPMGVLQLAVLDSCLKEAYAKAGMRQEDPSTWELAAPHFGQFETELLKRIAAEPEDVRLRGLRAKISPIFDSRIFSKPQAEIPILRTGKATPGRGLRLELASLPAALQYLATDTLLKQIFRRRQIAGVQEAVSLYLMIDETKLCTPARKDSPLAALNRLATEGRKFGMGLVVSSQFIGHLGRDVVVNTFTKILMKVDKTEQTATARRFRVEELRLDALRNPGDPLVNFADSNEWKEVRIGH
ncbi:MAG: ATP-binding protein [Acidobacteriota bacterium]